MLDYLRIQHLALLEDVTLELHPGLNVLTGETGAGKSFILKALNFLTGEKLGADLVRQGEEKARAEALFVSGDTETAIVREILAETGRSRVFVNDALASQEAVKNLRPSLLVHVSQHGQQQLLRPAFQAKLLDRFLPDSAHALITERTGLLTQLREAAQFREAAEARVRELADKREFLEFQAEEIEKVGPRRGEEAELESLRIRLRSSSGAQEAADAALDLLLGENGLVERLDRLSARLRQLTPVDDSLEADENAVVEARENLADLASRLRRADYTPDAEMELEAVEARLYELAQLRRKLKRTLDEIVDLGEEITENLSFLDSANLDLANLAKHETRLREELSNILEKLSAVRRGGASAFSKALEGELAQLGFSEHVAVLPEFSPHELHPGLFEDRGRILWLPNPGQAPQPLDKIASGGELSRFLLAVIGLTSEAASPTLIFDEVDAGVGGITLNALGAKLKKLAARQQVLLITHWPQLAALADRHFHIEKSVTDGATTTTCTRLTDDAVFNELSRMAGGGDKGAALARELLNG